MQRTTFTCLEIKIKTKQPGASVINKGYCGQWDFYRKEK